MAPGQVPGSDISLWRNAVQYSVSRVLSRCRCPKRPMHLPVGESPDSNSEPVVWYFCITHHVTARDPSESIFSPLPSPSQDEV